MINPLFDISQYQSGATQSYSTDWIDATGSDAAWDESELHPGWKNSTTEPDGNAQDSSTEAPTMAEQKAPESSYAEVEVVEELSPEEEADRQQLELRVERALYEGGSALRSLRDRRLYRSTHKTWEDYCQDRFGFNRTSAQHQISAAEVVGNLFTIGKQFPLPTNERQVRPLTKLEPDEQRQVWHSAVDAAGGRVPSGRQVKDAVLRHQGMGIVERLKQKHPSASEFAPGDVAEIKALKRSPLHPFNGMWAIIEHIGSFSYTVRISIARDTQQCKAEELTLIDEE